MIAGRGRIAIWEGAALWIMEGSETANLHLHAHHAIQITFQLHGWFEINLGTDQLAGPVAAVGSDALHGFRASGAVAFLFIAPESAVGIKLSRQLFAEQPWATINDGPLAAALEPLRACQTSAGSASEMRRIGKAILSTLPAAADPMMPDARVLAMLDYARHHLDGAVTLPAASAKVGLSPSRARHLFAAQTGLPFKSYVLWLRIERAVELFAAGHSLTEAAHEAGFADSAHFSRSFRRMYGLPAAALRLYRD